MDDKVHDEASDVTAAQGVVIVDGPDGVAVTLSPEAAIETSDRLLEAGMAARGQQLQSTSDGSPAPAVDG